jgi:hypothetical protein
VPAHGERSIAFAIAGSDQPLDRVAADEHVLLPEVFHELLSQRGNYARSSASAMTSITTISSCSVPPRFVQRPSVGAREARHTAEPLRLALRRRVVEFGSKAFALSSCSGSWI